MNTFSLIFFCAAAILFFISVVDAPPRQPRVYWVGLGLCILTIGFVIQFMATTHSQHF